MERDFIYLLEYDDNVKYYLEQPLEIEFIDSQGKKRRYIPDFLVEHFNDQIPRLVEIKYESTLISKGAELREKFNAAKLFCEDKGLEFCVITDLQISSEKNIELNNFKFLDRYKNFYRNINKEKSAFPGLREVFAYKFGITSDEISIHNFELSLQLRRILL